MADNEPSSKPPYPTIGEVCSLLASAFSTKSADPAMRKKLDRLAREGDFDWRLRPQVIEELLIKPLRERDPEFSTFVKEFVDDLLNRHINLLSAIPLDALSRDEAAPILIEHFYATGVAKFLISMHARSGGPDLGDFLCKDAGPVDVVFIWAENFLGCRLAITAFPDDKRQRDEITRWRRGDTIPDYAGSILRLKHALVKKHPTLRSGIAQFTRWLVAARALAWLDRETKEAGFGPLLSLIRKEILLNCPARDVGIVLSRANYRASRRLSEVAECGGILINSRLMRTTPKQIGDKAAAQLEIAQFKELLEKQDFDRRARYMLDWCEGRWHVLSGNANLALEFYERASNQALYRIGHDQEQLLKEAISLAAHVSARPAIKRLAHRARAMGLFSDVLAERSNIVDVISDREIEIFADSFHKMFPISAWFPEA